MATYVLVHGGGHGGWCYQRVARLLRAAGHEVYTPTLTGLGERSHLLPGRSTSISTSTDVAAVLHYEDLRDVILVGHSYGGMVITGVADRAADRIGRLVYLDAANPVNGQSLVDVAGPIIERPGRPARSSTASSWCCCRRPSRAVLRRDRPRRPGLDGRAADRSPVEVLRAAACAARTRPRSGRSRSTTSSARPRSPPATPSSWTRPAPRAGCGTSTPVTTS